MVGWVNDLATILHSSFQMCGAWSPARLAIHAKRQFPIGRSPGLADQTEGQCGCPLHLSKRRCVKVLEGGENTFCKIIYVYLSKRFLCELVSPKKRG